MPNFKYTALDQNGAEKTGFVTADNKIAAMEMVRAQGLLVRECEEAKGGASASAAKKKDAKKECSKPVKVSDSPAKPAVPKKEKAAKPAKEKETKKVEKKDEPLQLSLLSLL